MHLVHHKECWGTALLLFLLVLVCSAPYLVNGLLEGGDLTFTLSRIEGIADGLRTGQFPVKLHPYSVHGYGYAAPVFYPELFLYPFALLRLLSFPITTVYKLFMIFINALTVCIAYYAYARMFRSKWLGYAGSFAYAFGSFRLIDMFSRAAAGQELAIAFLPLVLYGFFLIMTADLSSPKGKIAFLPLALGMTGILGSHLLSGEIAVVFLVLACILCWKRTFVRGGCTYCFIGKGGRVVYPADARVHCSIS